MSSRLFSRSSTSTESHKRSAQTRLQPPCPPVAARPQLPARPPARPPGRTYAHAPTPPLFDQWSLPSRSMPAPALPRERPYTACRLCPGTTSRRPLHRRSAGGIDQVLRKLHQEDVRGTYFPWQEWEIPALLKRRNTGWGWTHMHIHTCTRTTTHNHNRPSQHSRGATHARSTHGAAHSYSKK
eukprot:scaffold9763_cov95-Isochrysis_galbana.AAC.1